MKGKKQNLKIKVLIADDHRIMREGLKSLLDQRPDIEIVAEAGDGLTALRLVREHRPDLIITDVSMPDMNGIEATRLMIREIPRLRVLALSMHADRGFLLKMLKAGASGYLLKESAGEELIVAIQTVMKNHLYISPALLDVLVKDYIRLASREETSAFSILTPRERGILQKLAEGKSVKEIAFDLDVSVKTVETFRRKIEDKLGLRSIVALTKYALREGITSL